MKKWVKPFIIIFAVLIALFFSLLIALYYRNSITNEIVNELCLENKSDKTICATIEFQSFKSRFGVIRYKAGKNEGFLPNFGKNSKILVYWSFVEDNPDYYLYKVEFKLDPLKLPEDIYKVEFEYLSDDNWTLNLYSKTISVISIKEKSTRLKEPYPDTEQ